MNEFLSFYSNKNVVSLNLVKCMNIHQIPEVISVHLNPKPDQVHLLQIEVSDFSPNNINEFNSLSIIYKDCVSAEKRELRVCNNITSFSTIDVNDNSSFFSLGDLLIDFNQLIDSISSVNISYLLRSIILCNRRQNDREIVSYIVKGYSCELFIIDAFTGEYVPMNQQNSLPNFKSINGYDVGYIFSDNFIMSRISFSQPSMVVSDKGEKVVRNDYYQFTVIKSDCKETEGDTKLSNSIRVLLNDSGKKVPYQYDGLQSHIMQVDIITDKENLKVSNIVKAIFSSNGVIDLKKTYYAYFYPPDLEQYDGHYVWPKATTFDSIDFVKSVLKGYPVIETYINNRNTILGAYLKGIEISWELGMDLSKAPMTCNENFTKYKFSSYTPTSEVLDNYKGVILNTQNNEDLFQKSYFVFPILGFYTVGTDKLGIQNGYCSYEFMPSRLLELRKKFLLFPELPINPKLRFSNITNVACKANTSNNYNRNKKEHAGGYWLNLAGSVPPGEDTEVPNDILFLERSTITMVISQKIIMEYIFERFISVLNISNITHSLYFQCNFIINDKIPFDGSNSVNLVETLGRNYVEGVIKINMKEYFLDLTLQLPVDSVEDNIETISYRFYPSFDKSSMYLMSEETHSTSAKSLDLFTQKFQAGMYSCFLTEDEKEVIKFKYRNTKKYDPQPLFNNHDVSYYFGEGIIIKGNYAFRDGHLSIDIFKNQNS